MYKHEERTCLFKPQVLIKLVDVVKTSASFHPPMHIPACGRQSSQRQPLSCANPIPLSQVSTVVGLHSCPGQLVGLMVTGSSSSSDTP